MSVYLWKPLTPLLDSYGIDPEPYPKPLWHLLAVYRKLPEKANINTENKTLTQEDKTYLHKVALVVLNQSLETQTKLFKTLWKKAAFKIFVDGGANQVYSSFDPTSYIPDLITGDFDSIKPNVRDFYKQQNVEIIETPDQNFTDFTKCLKILFSRMDSSQVERIVVLGALGGRLDHQFSNINTLYKMKSSKSDAHLQIYLISQTSLVFLLPEGKKNMIEINTGFEDEMCGLIPVGSLCEHVTTSGLKYNLHDQSMEFGQLISTSNSYDESKEPVCVEASKPLLWTMEIKY